MKKFSIVLFFVLHGASGWLSGQDNSDVFRHRREKLMSSFPDGVIVLAAAQDEEANRHEYHQDALFRYFTGMQEPGLVAILNPKAAKRYSVFIPEQSLISRIYGGSSLSMAEAKERFGADTVCSLQLFSQILRDALKTGNKIYRDPSNRYSERMLQLAFPAGKKAPALADIRPVTDEMRLIKDYAEIENLRKAVKITCNALLDGYIACKPGKYEYEVEAVIEYSFRRQGAPMPGYRSIVGSGPNAVILHYDRNTRLMQNGELLLMDVGAEWEGYSADVTRTIPVNGKFTKEQREIYDLVLQAEEEAIKVMLPGRGNLECHHRATEVLCEGLYKLGLMTDPKSIWQRKFYVIYRVNHWLGLDVHDVGSYGPASPDYRTYMFNTEEKGRSFEPGMVSTIEPGLYFRPDGLSQLYEIAGKLATRAEIDEFIRIVGPVYEKYKNIGIRIEDDVLITSEGNEVLSSCIPKSAEEIERIMKQAF